MVGPAPVPLHEVVLVTHKKPFFEGLLTSVVLLVVFGLTGGLALMFAVPLSGRVFGYDAAAPGYWTCALFVAAARWALGNMLGPVRPPASRKVAA